MSENQKLREVLQVAEAALSDIGDADREPGDDLAWCERRAAQSLPLIRQALALPTADHFPDATKMIEAAAPVGDREVFERTMMDKFGWQRNDFKLDDFGYFDGHTDTAWMAWQARAAMSAGDAVDAQRLDFIEKSARCDPKMDGQHVWWPTSLNKALKGPTLRAAIDEAMRKDKP